MATFNLTAAADNFNGTNKADTFNATILTYNLLDDDLFGNGGTDKLILSGIVGGTFNFDVNLNSIEIITLSGTAAINVGASGVLNAMSITGNSADNVLTGTGLSDTLTGGAGNDTLSGGGGDDKILLGSIAEFGATETINGGSDEDTLIYTGGAGTLTLTANVTSIEHILIGTAAGAITGKAAVNVNAAALGNAVSITGNNGANNITGTGFADVITGNGGNDILDGGEGNDTLTGGAGNDTLTGGEGNDSFILNSVSEFANGESINGGNGDDTLNYTGGAGTLTLTNLVTNIAAVQMTNTTANINISIAEMTGDVSLSGNDGNNILTGNGGENEITGGVGNDTLTGGAGEDDLGGGDGNDLIIIAAAGDHGGNEEINGGDGNDTIRFTATTGTLLLTDDVVNVENVIISTASGATNGTQAVNVDASALTYGLNLTGNNGANQLTGTDFDDVITGNSGNDTLDGGDGNDTLQGGVGADTINGGDGEDTVVIGTVAELAAGEVIDGEAGIDTLYYIGGGGTLDLTGRTVNNIERIEIQNLTASININASSITTNGVTMFGNNGTNTLTGTNQADTLFGLNGKDTLNGGGGNDELFGDAGDDTLNGGAGNDQLTGGLGTDKLNGEGDNDRFLFNSVAEFTGDTVNGGDGTDTLAFSSSTNGDTLTLLASKISNLEQVELSGLADLNVNASGMTTALIITGNGGHNSLTGGSANDTLVGGDGNDILTGGLGNDLFLMDDLATGDEMHGGAGDDTIEFLGSGQTLDLETNTVTGIEVFDITGTGDNTLEFTPLAIEANGAATVRVDGGVGDVVRPGIGWVQGDDTVIGEETYHQYTNEVRPGFLLQVDEDVNVVLNAPLLLSTVDGVNGSKLDGFGDVVGTRPVGDVNGDGIDDVILSDEAGGGVVAFGSVGGFGANFSLSGLTGESGFYMGTFFVASPGEAVSGAGDVNGDGFADLLIGAGDPGSPTSTSRWALVMGREEWPDTPFVLEDFPDTYNPAIGYDDDIGGGAAVSGDIDGDGYTDLVLADGGLTRATLLVHVLFGDPTSMGGTSSSTPDLRMRISPEPHRDAHLTVGDLNGDGYDDVIFGVDDRVPFGLDPEPEDDGRVNIVWGKPSYPVTAYADTKEISTQTDADKWVEILGEGIDAGPDLGRFGMDVGSGGDFNGDGIDDLIVGDTGRAHLIYGSTTPMAFSTNVEDLMDGTAGFRITAPPSPFGTGESVAFVGDLNGDGFDDVAVANASTNAGRVYVIFGSNTGFGAEFSVEDLNGANGFMILGPGLIQFGDIIGAFGETVGSAGDVNGDGYDDIIVGSPNLNDSWIVYGKDFSLKTDFEGGADNDSFIGTAANEQFVTGAGNDTADGAGGADVLKGGAGNDVLAGGAGNDRLEGDNGNDVLDGGADADRLDGGIGNDTLDGGLGNDTLEGGLGNDAFLFNDALGAANVDVIKDFAGAGAPALDVIQLENAVFTVLTATGVLDAGNFVSGASPAAAQTDDFILYNTSTGELFYDADGTGVGAAVKFAVLLSDPDALDHTDFLVV